MLGLGLALSVGKKLLGDAIGRLIQKLSIRGTYSENLIDTRNIITDIDDADILDKATILLTPTATSDARVHSVKTYTGEELVTDGSFENGLSDWDSSNNVSIVGGAARFNNIGLSGANAYLNENSILEAGKTYKFECDVISTNGKDLVLEKTNPGNTSIGATTTGHKIIYFTQGTQTHLTIKRIASETDVTIDNISVTEADADFDFDRASSATRINSDGLVQDMQSITDPELVLNGDFEELGSELVTNGTFDTDSDWTLTQATISGGTANLSTTDGSLTSIVQSVTTVGKIYYFSFEVSDLVGELEFAAVGGSGVYSTITSNGTHTGYFTSVTESIEIKRKFGITNVSATIDNVSVQQVDPNDYWDLEVSWSIVDGKLKSDGTFGKTAFQENIFSQAGSTYKIKFDVNVISGSLSTRVRMGDIINGHTTISNITSEGSYTLYATAVANQDNLNFTTLSDNTAVYTIDNVSVKDITFSTDVDLARINYDSNGENGHILLEPTSTNLITYSEDFSQWNKGVSTTVTPNFAISPDGTQNATRFQTPTGSGTYLTLAASMTIGNDYTLTLFLKNNGGENIDIGVAASSTVGTKTASVEVNLTNEWVRYELNFTADSNSNFVFIDNINNANSVDCLIWGAQLEELSYATSYIPSLTGSTVTRATETLTGSGNSTLINSTEGVLYAEIAALADDETNREITLSDGTQNNYVLIRFNSGGSNRIYTRVDVGNSIEYFHLNTSYNIKNTNKIAIKFKNSDFCTFINGTKVNSQLSGNAFSSNTLNKLNFDNGLGSNDFYGKVKALAVFNEALSDTELENLTS
jgi:hypothetical protein